MNQKGNEHCSRAENYYHIKLKRVERCPQCRQVGSPMKGNHLIMEHRVDGEKGVVYHRWSYSTGRKIDPQSEETNVL
jgi:hypothetical protein